MVMEPLICTFNLSVMKVLKMSKCMDLKCLWNEAIYDTNPFVTDKDDPILQSITYVILAPKNVPEEENKVLLKFSQINIS